MLPYLIGCTAPSQYTDFSGGLASNPITAALKGCAVAEAHATFPQFVDANAVWSGKTVTRYNKGIARYPLKWTQNQVSFNAVCTPITSSDMLFAIVVDGVLQASIKGAGDAVEHRYYAGGLTMAAGGSTVEIWEPFTARAVLNNGADNQLEAGYVTGLWLPDGMAITRPTASTLIVTVGDSILGDSTDQTPELFYGPVGRLRLLAQAKGWLLSDISYGSCTAAGDGYTGAQLATFIVAQATQVGATTVKVLFQIGRNDWAYYGNTQTNSPTVTANLIQACVTALPAGYVKVISTPTPNTSEVANGGGFTLGDYRTKLALVTGATILDGTSYGIVTGTDLGDGVHLNHLGVAKNVTGVQTALGLP